MESFILCFLDLVCVINGWTPETFPKKSFSCFIPVKIGQVRIKMGLFGDENAHIFDEKEHF